MDQAAKPVLHRLLGTDRVVGVPPLPRPDRPICVVGDLHGRADLLDMMLALIAAEPDGGVVQVVFVGDLIDRGPDSAGVLSLVHALAMAEPQRFFCVMGNHERLLLAFLVAPDGRAKRWLYGGGVATLRSFGLASRRPEGADFAAHSQVLAQSLHDALLPDLLPWIKALPLYWQGQGLAVVHASAVPDRPMADQPETALLLGHPAARTARGDGLWIAHGHVIVPDVRITPGRIALDTGAYRTGRLSGIWLDGEGARVISVHL